MTRKEVRLELVVNTAIQDELKGLGFMKRIVIAMSGATGAIYGIKLLERIRNHQDTETHLILSPWAEKTISLETSYTVNQVKALASIVHDFDNLGASIASGSYLSESMVIIPCSMKTLAAISHGYADNLISRVADVMIKEGRKLILVPRETPLNPIHLENMLKLAHLGVKICPPMPAFYNHPQNIEDIINHFVERILQHLGFDVSCTKVWLGFPGVKDQLNKV